MPRPARSVSVGTRDTQRRLSQPIRGMYSIPMGEWMSVVVAELSLPPIQWRQTRPTVTSTDGQIIDARKQHRHFFLRSRQCPLRHTLVTLMNERLLTQIRRRSDAVVTSGTRANTRRTHAEK